MRKLSGLSYKFIYVYFVIIVMAGWNFVAEFIISAVLSPVVYTVVRVVGRSVGKKQSAAPARGHEKAAGENFPPPRVLRSFA